MNTIRVTYQDALEQGWRVFPLYPIVDGRCGCGDERCESAGKHPRDKSWQNTPVWSDVQLAYLEDDEGVFHGNQLLEGYGVVVNTSGLLVVDVDGRNGGFASAEKLKWLRDQCGFIVRTGSHDGEHWYFKMPEHDKRLSSAHRDYKGIDFKSSGYVVGCFSRHVSGNRYECIHGGPEFITEAPIELIELIESKRPEGKFEVGDVKVSIADIGAMLHAIDNPDGGLPYSEWVKIGMAVHHATEGSKEGFDLWMRWSLKGVPDDDVEYMERKWFSFGKHPDPVTQGTLIDIAREHGYSQPVEFVDDTDWSDDEPAVKRTKKPEVDLLAPPGFVGEITQWINSRCAYPREKLAVAAALQIVSNAAGLNHMVAGRRTTLNLITLAIAGSRTGKGAVKRCIDEAHRELGILPAVHGKFKSSQELVRNAIHHQMIAYVYDEFGKQLEKLAGAGRSGAHYLEDLLAELMAMYSEADGTHGLSGDVKREIADEIDKRIAAEVRRLGDGVDIERYLSENKDSDLARLYEERERAEQGIVGPYLTFFGMSEPSSFNAALEKDDWLLTGGFLGRALIFEEEETVPKEKPASEISTDPMPAFMAAKLQAMLSAGHAMLGRQERIERRGDWLFINWSECGQAFMEQVRQYWHDAAIAERDSGSSLESQALGAAELVIKISGILSADTKLITQTEVAWAHELIKSITHDKIERARSSEMVSSRAPKERGAGLINGIMRHMHRLGGEETTVGRIRNAVGRTKVSTDDVMAALNHLEGQARVVSEERAARNGRKFKYYRLA